MDFSLVFCFGEGCRGNQAILLRGFGGELKRWGDSEIQCPSPGWDLSNFTVAENSYSLAICLFLALLPPSPCLYTMVPGHNLYPVGWFWLLSCNHLPQPAMTRPTHIQHESHNLFRDIYCYPLRLKRFEPLNEMVSSICAIRKTFQEIFSYNSVRISVGETSTQYKCLVPCFWLPGLSKQQNARSMEFNHLMHSLVFLLIQASIDIIIGLGFSVWLLLDLAIAVSQFKQFVILITSMRRRPQSGKWVWMSMQLKLDGGG